MMVGRTLCSAVLVVLFSGLALPAPAQNLELDTVEFFSPAVDRNMKYNILLPSDYASSAERYPVLYLLHGLTGNYTNWGRSNGSPFYASLYDDVIIVMPDVGNSWYVNWAENEGGQQNNWEDHVVTDVVNHVDWNFRTIARREGRAISGLSMGGYGAITLGLRHPDMFISIGSTSGALEYARGAAQRLSGDASAGRGRGRELTPEQRAARQAQQRRPNPLIGVDGFSSQVERTPQGRAFATIEDAAAYDPFTLIDQVPPDQLPHIYLDCGTEDRLIAGARELAGILMERDIPFDYMQMGGAHNSAYWIQSMGRIIGVQYEVMQRALGQRPSGRRRPTN